MLTSDKIDHTPGPEETGPFYKCPWCGLRGLVIYDLCKKCKQSEEGKYKTKLQCIKCGKEELRQDYAVKVMTDLKIDFTPGPKRDLGIKTITDEGIK